MKFTLKWLRDHLETDASVAELEAALTSIGLEVENVQNPNEQLAGFNIVEIISVSKHPDADKLQVCKVDTGKKGLKQIICGASNVREGMKTVLASPGNVIPQNGNKIKISKIRGVESQGMLCSSSELNLGEDFDGIIELNDNCENGLPASEALDLDVIFEISLTPNRVDALGVRGIARDLAAKGIGKLKQEKVCDFKSSFKTEFKISSKLPEEAIKLCPHFSGRVIKGVKNSKTPAWLSSRLEAIGLRSVSALVDITQYITIDLGRPLHAFDLSKLDSFIGPRLAKASEEIDALDGKNYKLSEATLVIADKKDPQAIAGIIGGMSSACSEETECIFLESAYFDPNSIAKSGRSLGILSDARYCFERGVDPESTIRGLELATQLILDICGGEASELISYGEPPKISFDLNFRLCEVERFSGLVIDKKTVVEILEKLGFQVTESNEDVLKINVPSWRRDIDGEQDIVEEILRIYGYDKIKTHKLPEMDISSQLNSRERTRDAKIRRFLVSKGFSEVITWSFLSNESAELFSRDEALIKLKNPISSDLDTLRPSIVPNLLSSIQKNLVRGLSDMSFFEIGPVFNNNLNRQNQIIGAVRVGNYSDKHWKKDYRPTDVFDVKSDALDILNLMGIPKKNIITKQYNLDLLPAPSWYHPGQSGILSVGKNIVAEFGRLHPYLLNQFEIEEDVFCFEVFIDNIPKSKKTKSFTRKKFSPSHFQSVERDFAFLIDDDIPVEDILRKVSGVDKNLISSVKLFDMYKGDKIESEKKSIAFSILLEPKDKTMNISEIEDISSRIIKMVEKDFEAKLRH